MPREEDQMLHNIFLRSTGTRIPSERTRARKAPLSEAERASLRLFVVRRGDGIADDTSPFSSTERKRLVFLQWLDRHGKLSS